MNVLVPWQQIQILAGSPCLYKEKEILTKKRHKKEEALRVKLFTRAFSQNYNKIRQSNKVWVGPLCRRDGEVLV